MYGNVNEYVHDGGHWPWRRSRSQRSGTRSRTRRTMELGTRKSSRTVYGNVNGYVNGEDTGQGDVHVHSEAVHVHVHEERKLGTRKSRVR